MYVVSIRLRHMLLFLSILLEFIPKSLSHLPEMSNETLGKLTVTSKKQQKFQLNTRISLQNHRNYMIICLKDKIITKISHLCIQKRIIVRALRRTLRK